MLFENPPSKEEIIRRTKRIQESESYQKGQRLIQSFLSKGLQEGTAIDVLIHATMFGNFMRFLQDYLNEKSWANDSIGVGFQNCYDEEDLEEFGPNTVMFSCNYGLTWDDGAVNEQEACKYLEVAVEFYAKEHPEEAKEVYAYLDKIKEKYHVS